MNPETAKKGNKYLCFCGFPGLDVCAAVLSCTFVLANSGASAESKHNLRFKFIHQDVFFLSKSLLNVAE